jgi:hypothetical protein
MSIAISVRLEVMVMLFPRWTLFKNSTIFSLSLLTPIDSIDLPPDFLLYKYIVQNTGNQAKKPG